MWRFSELVTVAVYSIHRSVHSSVIVSSLNSSSCRRQSVSGEVSGTFSMRSSFRSVISAPTLSASSLVFPSLQSSWLPIGRCRLRLVGSIVGRLWSCCLKTSCSSCWPGQTCYCGEAVGICVSVCSCRPMEWPGRHLVLGSLMLSVLLD